MAFFTVARSTAESSRKPRRLDCGERLYHAGGEGLAWRLQHGVIRLDSPHADGERFASLAIAGDIVGCETLLFGAYTFSASALTRCQLAPWPEGEPALAGESMLASLARAQQRAAEIVALRGDQAIDRVLGLIRLLVDRDGHVILPMRQDIAAITDLRGETVSRIIKGLERARVLAPVRIDGVHATRSFALAAAPG
jgi:CRP-like cAMP-binding protein